MLQMRSHLFLSWLESNTWAFCSVWNVYKSELKLTFLGNRKEERFAVMGQPHWERHHRGLFLLVREMIIQLVKLCGLNWCSWAEKMIPFESGSLYVEPGCPYCLSPKTLLPHYECHDCGGDMILNCLCLEPYNCLESLWTWLCVSSDAGHRAAGGRTERELTVAGYCYMPDTNDLIYFSQPHELVIISVLLIPNLKKLRLLYKGIYLVITKLEVQGDLCPRQ